MKRRTEQHLSKFFGDMDAIEKYLKESLTEEEYRILQRQESKYNLKGERVVGLSTTLKLLGWIKLRYLIDVPEETQIIDEAISIVEALYKERATTERDDNDPF